MGSGIYLRTVWPLVHPRNIPTYCLTPSTPQESYSVIDSVTRLPTSSEYFSETEIKQKMSVLIICFFFSFRTKSNWIKIILATSEIWDAAQTWLVSLKIVSSVSRFKSALNLNRFLTVQRRGLNSLYFALQSLKNVQYFLH